MIERYLSWGAIMKLFPSTLLMSVAGAGGIAEGTLLAANCVADALGYPRINLEKIGVFNAEEKAKMHSTFTQVEHECAELGFVASRASAGRLIELSTQSDISMITLNDLCKEFNRRLRDELASVSIYFLESTKRHYVDSANLFGEQVAQAFPSISFDVEEAGKCLAFGRSTASVFHLMRALEAGLYTIAGDLGVQDIEPNWHNAIEQTEKQIKSLPRKTLEEKTVFTFYSDAAAYLFAVKEPWRNRSAHSGHTYTEEKAEQIFHSVRGFMQVLSTRLTEKPL